MSNDKTKESTVDAESASNKETSIPNDQAFEEARYHMDKVISILENEAQRVRQEKEVLDDVAKKLKHVHFSSTIKLNVGGQFFTTSLQTLTKDAGSMLHAMFSGRFDTKPAEDGSYFIDRDGTYFRYILNYLRTGKLILPDDKLIREEILEEAKFYQVQGIMEDTLTRTEAYSQSVILSPEQRLWLIEAVGKPDDNYSLLYRASVNGWSCTNFHACCDNKGPTLVVIKSGNYIFGGYTTQSWDGSSSWKADGGAFLFSLISHGSSKPTMMRIKDSTYAISCNSGYGPTFGGGHDLHIVNNPNSNNCTVNIGFTYNCPPGQTGTTFLTGNQNFTVSEIEVFQQ